MNNVNKWEFALAKETKKEYQQQISDFYTSDDGKTTKMNLAEKFALISGVLANYTLLGLESRKKWQNDAQSLDLVKIFNPISLTWDNPKYIYTACLNAVDVLYTQNDVVKLSNFIFENLRNSQDTIIVPEPYNGSRYILFENGVFDCLTQKIISVEPTSIPSEHDCNIPYVNFDSFLEINGEEIPIYQVGFIEKHKHFIKLDLDIQAPNYKGYGNTETWNPETWLLKTANNNLEKAKYILTIIGMMIVPNHWFNAFIEINGKSGSGKTVITNIAKSIYGGNDVAIPEDFTIEQAQDNFPFRGLVNQNTALVHITEVNGTYLNANMISLFNSFANSSMEMKQMGDVSVKLTPPPLLVLEGVSWAKFDNTKTGVARRLLPLDLTDADTKGYRSSHNKDIFAFKKVVQWFAKAAVLAFSDLTHGDDHFSFNIDDTSTLPIFAQKWHMLAINAGDDLMNTYMLKIKKSLHSGYLPIRMMYEIYQKSVEDDDPEQKRSRKFRSFKDALKMYLSEDFDVEVKDDLQKHSEDELGIDLHDLTNAMELPKGLENYNNTHYGKFSIPYWFKITRKEAF